jgi:hypothetical protein
MAVLMTADTNWGVTVAEVAALAPHVSIGPGPATPVDLVFGKKADRVITNDEVEGFIREVAGRVSLRLTALHRIEDPVRGGAIAQAAHDAAVNGAASYLVAAAHPAGSINNDGGYAAILWARYESAIDLVGLTLDGWIAELPAAAPAPTGSAAGFFPAPMFPDGGRS